jgi:hypothetical protein
MSRLLVPSNGQGQIGTADLIQAGKAAPRIIVPEEYWKLEPAFLPKVSPTYCEGLAMIKEAGFERYLTPAEMVCFWDDWRRGAHIPGEWNEIRKAVHDKLIWSSSVCWRRNGKLEIYENPGDLTFFNVEDGRKHVSRIYAFYEEKVPAPDASLEEPAGEYVTIGASPEDLAGYMFRGVPEKRLASVAFESVYLLSDKRPFPLYAEFSLSRQSFLSGNCTLASVLGVREEGGKG